MTVTPPLIPATVTDVGDWLGIEVIPRPATQEEPETCVVHFRPIGSAKWVQRPGTPQELRLYRAITALVRTVPREGRDVVLDETAVEELRRVFDLDTAPTAQQIRQQVRTLSSRAARVIAERDGARRAASATNEDLIAVVEAFRTQRSAARHVPNSGPAYRQEGELNMLAWFLRVLRGEDVGPKARRSA